MRILVLLLVAPPLAAAEDFAKCIQVSTRIADASHFEFTAVNNCHATFKDILVNFKFFDKDGNRFASTSFLNGELSIPTFVVGERVRKQLIYPAGTVSVLVRELQSK